MEAAWPVPEDLVVYGGIGKAARNWECFDKIVNSLRTLTSEQTLLIQSGKPAETTGLLPSKYRRQRVSLAVEALGTGGAPSTC